MKRISFYLFSWWLICACLGSVGAQQPTNQAEANEPSPKPEARQHKPRHTRERSPARDQIAVGGNLVVKPDETIADGIVVGGTGTIDGNVKGDLIVVLGQAKLGPTANVAGDLIVVGGSTDIDPEARVAGDNIVVGSAPIQGIPGWLQWPKDWFLKGFLLGRPLPHQVVGSWVIAGVFLGLYVLAALFFPRSVQTSVEVLASRPGTSFLSGLLALLFFGPLVALLFVTFVGWILIPFLICGFIAAFIFGKVAVYRYAGQQFGGQVGLEFLQKPLVALLSGIFLFYLLYTIPVLGMVVWFAVAPLGLGAVLMAFSRRVRNEDSRPNPVEPVTVVVPPPLQAGIGQPPMPETVTTLSLARAGFWLRLTATLIDLILVGLVSRLLHLPGAALIIIWSAYHVALWTWKGTTIGGIVLGLKIVRTNGQPIDLSISLVRCLSSFLSAAALCIGFFWAGWSSEKQSWHDKIAGTYIVKMPRGVSLV